MPTISRFYGMIIQMYFDDHNPPHFHVIYGEYKAVVGIKNNALLGGDLPPKAIGLVMEWTRLHQAELLDEWVLARNRKTLFPIQPLV